MCRGVGRRVRRSEVAVYRARQELGDATMRKAARWAGSSHLTWFFHAMLEGAEPKKLMTPLHIEMLDKLVAGAHGGSGR